MTPIRSFIALPSPPELQTALSNLQAQLKVEKADVRWDDPKKFHITLKFLGNVEEQQLALVSEAVKAIASEIAAFDLVYSTLGVFPDFARPRVIWAGAEDNETAKTLQREVEAACVRLGFPKEEKAFHPHITLGRVKGTSNLNRLTAKAKSITFDPITTHCSELLLIKSTLNPTGSVYSTLNSFPLKA